MQKWSSQPESFVHHRLERRIPNSTLLSLSLTCSGSDEFFHPVFVVIIIDLGRSMLPSWSRVFGNSGPSSFERIRLQVFSLDELSVYTSYHRSDQLACWIGLQIAAIYLRLSCLLHNAIGHFEVTSPGTTVGPYWFDGGSSSKANRSRLGCFRSCEHLHRFPVHCSNVRVGTLSRVFGAAILSGCSGSTGGRRSST